MDDYICSECSMFAHVSSLHCLAPLWCQSCNHSRFPPLTLPFQFHESYCLPLCNTFPPISAAPFSVPSTIYTSKGLKTLPEMENSPSPRHTDSSLQGSKGGYWNIAKQHNIQHWLSNRLTLGNKASYSGLPSLLGCWCLNVVVGMHEKQNKNRQKLLGKD